MSEILFVGDLHSNVNAANGDVLSAASKGITKIVQAGDNGFIWSLNARYMDELDAVTKMLVREGVEMYWIDGNHENHWLLKELCKVAKKVDDFYELVLNFFYIPRGTRWEWEGVKFLGLGGAYSVDQQWRKEGVSWWPDEIISEADVRRSMGPKVDIMVTHDAPWGTRGLPSEKNRFEGTAANQKALRAVFDVVHPKLLVHGHYHYRNTARLGSCLIEGLDRDGTGGKHRLVVDLDSFKNS